MRETLRWNVNNGAFKYGAKKTVHKKQCPSPFPPPAAKTPRLEGAALLHLLPAVRHRRSRPHPSARATPWDPRAARSFAFAHAASEGELGLALQQCSRSCTASANQLQQQCTAKLRSPVPVGQTLVPSHGLCRAGLGRRWSRRSTYSELRHALHTARTRPPDIHTRP